MGQRAATRELPMQRIVLTFGLVGGAVIAVMMALTLPFQDQIGFDRGVVVGYTTMVLAFLMVYFGVRSYRDTAAGGTLTFGRAFRVGLLISLVITVCYVVTWQVMYYGFMPDFLDKYTAYALEKARLGGASEAQLAQQAKDLAEFAVMYRNPLVNIAYTFLEPLPVGLVFTLVTAGVLGRTPVARTTTAPTAPPTSATK
jgi:Protein of unknown function (DUF4199)